MKYFIFLLLLIFDGYNWCVASNDLRGHWKEPDPTYRLPNDTLPIHYDLILETDLYDFNGSVIITIVAQRSTNRITLHSQNLEIVSLELVDENSDKIEITEIEFDENRLFLLINLAENLVVEQTYYLNISQFTGRLAQDNDGFYLALYNENGETK